MKKIRIGVFGAYRGTSMISYCEASACAEVVAICDKWEEALEIQKENMKVINHFHTYCRDYFRKTYKKLFQEENLEDDFFQ